MHTYMCAHTYVYVCCPPLLSRYHLECLTPPLHAVPVGNWYCPTCAPIIGVLEQNGDQSSTDVEEVVLLAESDDEALCSDRYNLRPRQGCVHGDASSDEEAGLSGHAYHLRSSATGHIASREQSESGHASLDSRGAVCADEASVTLTASDVHLDRADVTFIMPDNDTSDSPCQPQPVRPRRSRQLLHSSDDDDTIFNMVSAESESDDGVCVRRRRDGRRKPVVSLETSESECDSEGEVEECASGSGEAEWVLGGEDDSSSGLSCELEENRRKANKGKEQDIPEEESVYAEDDITFNDVSTISIQSGYGVASSNDATGMRKSPCTPLRGDNKGVLSTRRRKAKERARPFSRRSSRKRRKLAVDSGKGSSSQTTRKRRVGHKKFKRKSRKRITMPVLSSKRRLDAGESSGTSSAGAMVSIPETPVTKWRLAPGCTRTHAMSTPVSHPQARVVASTPTSSLRQAQVQRAVREYATTGALPPVHKWEPKPGTLVTASDDRIIEQWVQHRHRSPSWMREAVERRKERMESPHRPRVVKESSSPSCRWRSRIKTSSTKPFRETPSRQLWKQAELNLPKISRRSLPQTQRCVGGGGAIMQ